MNRFFITIFIILFCVSGKSQEVDSNYIFLSFEQAIHMAMEQSVAALTQETQKENNYWQNKTFKSRYLPYLALTSDLPSINRGMEINTTDDGGQTINRIFNARPSVSLQTTQLIPFTGGSISLGTSFMPSYDIQNDEVLYKLIPVSFRWNQPLFQFNQHPWDRKIEELRYTESEKDVALEMEQIAINTTRLFFNLMISQIEKSIAELNVTNNDTILKIARGRYDLGRIAENELLQIELQYINAGQALDQANIDIQENQIALRNYIGLQNDKELVLLLPDFLYDLDINAELALEKARKHRPEIIEFERRRLMAERNVKEAVKNSGFNADLNVSVGLDNADPDLALLTNQFSNNQGFNVSLEVPILQWGRSKSAINQAKANQKLVDYNIQQQLINFEEEILSQVNSFPIIRKQVDIAKRADEIAQKRFEVTKNRYLIGNITITDMNIATTERDEAKMRYINAISSYWSAYYNLRKLTLYDFVFKTDIVK